MKIKIVSKKNYRQLKEIYASFDVSSKGSICLAVGGDGTFVRAAKQYEGPILPIRSEESGSIGYYSDVSLNDIDFVIKSLKSGSYYIEKLENKMEVSFNGKRYYAVNEALLHNTLEEVSFKIYELRGGKRYEIYPYVMSGDGILITSSIGSTAYNKSAGGPIMLIPNAMCLTFLNVDGPYKNPIVVDSSRVIEVEVVKYNGQLRYDGEVIKTLKPKDSFRVRVSEKELKIVRFKKRREELARKLDRIIRSRMAV
jgi:NAD+ kinase